MSDFPIQLAVALCPSRHSVKCRAYDDRVETPERAEQILREEVGLKVCRHCGAPLAEISSVPTGFATLAEAAPHVARVNADAMRRASMN